MGVQSIKSNPAMISLLVLVASAACAPQYGPPPPLPPTRPPPVPTPSPSPEKLIAPVTPAVACTVAYVTVWDTEYHDHENEVCETVYEQVCNTRTQRLCQPTTRQECTTNYVEECSTIYKNVCVQKFRTEYEPYTESECTTEYKQDCQYEWRGHGNDKVWAPIDGTCQNVPYDECRDVAKTHAKQVAYQECNDVPEQKCVSVPKHTCVTVPDQICKTEPLTECQDVPRQQCHSEHKRFPVRISKQAPKKVCDEVHSTAPLAAAAVHQAPVHHQASPSVQDLLNYGVPAVPTQTVPQIIDARDKQRLQSAAKDDRIVFA